MKKFMPVLALAFAVPAVFSEILAAEPLSAAAPNPAAGQIKLLRGAANKEEGEMSAKLKMERAEVKELLARQKAELEKIRSASGTRSEKKALRKALHERFAKLIKDARERRRGERRMLREDIKSKRGQANRLRQS